MTSEPRTDPTDDEEDANDQGAGDLDQISTRWTQLHNPATFALRYASALSDYLTNLLGDPDRAEEVLQEVLLKMMNQGFANARPERGRFRDYLKVATRNQALALLRREQRRKAVPSDQLENLLEDRSPTADQLLLGSWRTCVVEKAWRALERHEHQAPHSLVYTALKLTIERPDIDSEELAKSASSLVNRKITAEAFRKQRSRARRLFAKLLIAEVAATIDPPTPEEIDEELCLLGLKVFVQDVWPND